MTGVFESDIITAIALLQLIGSLRYRETGYRIGIEREPATGIGFIRDIHCIGTGILIIHIVDIIASECFLRLGHFIPAIIESFRRYELAGRRPTAVDTLDLTGGTGEGEIRIAIVYGCCTAERRDFHFHMTSVKLGKVESQRCPIAPTYITATVRIRRIGNTIPSFATGLSRQIDGSTSAKRFTGRSINYIDSQTRTRLFVMSRRLKHHRVLQHQHTCFFGIHNIVIFYTCRTSRLLPTTYTHRCQRSVRNSL